MFPSLIFAVQQWAAPLLFAWDLMEACIPKRQAKASSSKTDDLVCLGIVSSEEANVLSQMYVGIEALSGLYSASKRPMRMYQADCSRDTHTVGRIAIFHGFLLKARPSERTPISLLIHHVHIHIEPPHPASFKLPSGYSLHDTFPTLHPRRVLLQVRPSERA